MISDKSSKSSQEFCIMLEVYTIITLQPEMQHVNNSLL